MNPSFSYPEHFSIPENNEALRDSPTNFFGTARQKIFNGKSSDSAPSPLLSINFFAKRSFLKHSTERSPMKFFETVKQKVFDGKSWYSPLLSINFFATGHFLKHRSEGLLDEIFWDCETKNLDTKSRHNSLKHKISRYPKIVTQRTVLLWTFLSLWDKKISTEYRDTHPPFYP